MIYVFCQNHGIAIGSYLRSSIQAPDFAVEIVEILIGQHNAGVAGAKNLIASIAAPDSKNANDERIFYNHLTEGFGVWFAHKNLGASIRVIEEASNPVRSPHARNPSKSCDFSATLSGALHFFEVKDFSIDQGRAYASTGMVMFTPATNQEKRKWIEKKIGEALNKGANYMIARVSTWTPRGRAVAEDKIIKEVLFDYHDVSQNEAEIVVRFAVPDWFKGLYLVKRQGHVFVRIKEAAKHLPHTTAPL